MPIDRGRNAGVTGLVDIPGAPGGAAKFNVRIYGFKQALEVSTRSRNGRATGRWGRSRRILSSGNLILTGDVRLDAYPLPSKFEGQEGTVTLQVGTGKTQAVPVRVTASEIRLNEKEEDTWKIALTCEITGEPVFAGFGGSQSPATDPPPSDQELYEGLSKTFDPKGLQSGATVKFDVFGLGDDDQSEWSKLAAIIASAVATLAGLKARTTAFLRTDADGGTVDLTFGLTDTADDVVLPRTTTTIDPAGLTSAANVAALNATPAAPTGDTFVKTGSTAVKLNDGVTLNQDAYGKRTSQQAIEFDGSPIIEDPTDLADQQTVTRVTQSATPPTLSAPGTLKIRDTRSQQTDIDHYTHVFEYSRRDHKDDIELDGTFTNTDPSDLRTTGRKTQVFDTVGAVPTYSPPAGLQVIGTTTAVINNVKSRIAFETGKNTPKDEVEQNGTYTLTDPSGLESASRASKLDTTPTLPAGFVSRGTRAQNLTPDHVLNTIEGGLRTTAEDREMPGTYVLADPNGIDSTGRKTSVFTTASGTPADPTPPAGLQIVGSQTQQVNQTRSEAVWQYGVVNSKQRLEYQHQRIVADPRDLKSSQWAAQVFNNGGVPSDPLTPAGLKLADTQDLPITPTQSIRIWKFDKTDSKDDVELPQTVTFTDPLGLTSHATAAAVDGTPALPAGFIARGTRSVKLTPDHTAAVIEGGTRSTVDDVEMPGTHTYVDPTRLNSSGRKTQVYATASGLPADATPPTGTKIVGRKSESINQTYSAVAWEFGVATEKNRLEWGGTHVTTDANGLASNAAIAVVHDLATPAPTPAAPAGQKLVTQRVIQKTDDQAVTQFEYAVNDSRDQLQFGHTRAVYTVTGAGESAFAEIFDWSGTASALAESVFNGNKADVTFEQVEVRKVAPDKALQIITHRAAFQIVNARATGGKWPTMAILDDKNQVTVFINELLVRGSGFYMVHLIPQWIYQGAMTFTLKRRVSGTTLPMHFELLGTTNDAPFLGLPAKTVTYLGAEPQANISINAPRVSEMAWHFKFDSLGMFSNDQIAMGWIFSNAPKLGDFAAAGGRGWFPAYQLGWSAKPLEALDYQVFFQ